MFSFLVFSGGIKREYGLEISYVTGLDVNCHESCVLTVTLKISSTLLSILILSYLILDIHSPAS